MEQKGYYYPECNADAPKRFYDKSVPRPGLGVLEEILSENFLQGSSLINEWSKAG
jgi:hypothetical protein